MKTVILSLVLICVSTCPVLAQKKNLSFANSSEIFKLLGGKWSFGSHDCQNPFVFTVASDQKSIKVIYKDFDKQANKEQNKEYSYKVIDADRFRIRAQVEGEKRLTDDGKPVVWDFYFFSHDEFRWHRTDWGNTGFTPPVIRCKEENETAFVPSHK